MRLIHVIVMIVYRPTTGAPKPNTRFLKHIIKETDSHNAALKRKEEREARERMRQLRGHHSSSSHVSKRDNWISDDRELKRSRDDDREDRHHHHSHRRRHRSRSISPGRDSSRRHRRQRGEDDIEHGHRHRSSRKDRRHDGDERYRSRHERSHSRSRSGSPRGERSRHSRSRHHRHRHSTYRSPSPPRSRSRSPERSRRQKYKEGTDGHGRQKSLDESRSYGRHHHAEEPPSPITLHNNNPSEEESDPLEDLVGPLPPKTDGLDDAILRPRGRGAYKTNVSNIDAHFAPDYDPTLDVELDGDDANTVRRSTRRPVAGLMTKDDDWELALEALRDRARWRQKGEERLREAGFNDNIVERWKSNTAFTGSGDMEKGLEQVKWSKKGESREWDRGKVIDEDGHVDVKAPW